MRLNESERIPKSHQLYESVLADFATQTTNRILLPCVLYLAFMYFSAKSFKRNENINDKCEIFGKLIVFSFCSVNSQNRVFELFLESND